MWKWLAVATACYGLLVVGIIASPRVVGLARLADMGAAWRMHPDIPPVHDFERETPPPVTFPQSASEVISLPGGNHVLQWSPAVDVPVSMLALPVVLPADGISALNVDIRSSSPGTVLLGVREHDGSLYGAMRPVKDDRKRYVVPLKELRHFMKTGDENAQLDLDQVDAIFIAVLSPEGLREHVPEKSSEFEGRSRVVPHSALPDEPLIIEIDHFGLLSAAQLNNGPADGIPPQAWEPHPGEDSPRGRSGMKEERDGGETRRP